MTVGISVKMTWIPTKKIFMIPKKKITFINYKTKYCVGKSVILTGLPTKNIEHESKFSMENCKPAPKRNTKGPKKHLDKHYLTIKQLGCRKQNKTGYFSTNTKKYFNRQYARFGKHRYDKLKKKKNFE